MMQVHQIKHLLLQVGEFHLMLNGRLLKITLYLTDLIMIVLPVGIRLLNQWLQPQDGLQLQAQDILVIIKLTITVVSLMHFQKAKEMGWQITLRVQESLVILVRMHNFGLQLKTLQKKGYIDIWRGLKLI